MSERTGAMAVQKVRQLYPGSYDSYSDKEVLDALKRKYPGSYEDLQVSESIQPSENVLQRAMRAGKEALTELPSQGFDIAHGPGYQVGNLFKQKMFGINPNPLESLGGYTIDYFTDPRNYANAIVGAGTKPVTNIGKVASYVPKVFNRSGRTQVVEGFQKELSQKRWSTMPRWFGREMDRAIQRNPGKTVDLSGILEQAKADSLEDPKLASVLRHPKIARLFDEEGNVNSDLASSVPLEEMQDIKNAITPKVPAKELRGESYSSQTRGTRNLLNSIGQKIAGLDEQFADVIAGYGKKSEQYKQFAPQFSSKNSVENILKGPNVIQRFTSGRQYLGGEKPQEAFKNFSPRIEREVTAARQANKLLGAMKYGTGIGLGYEVLKKLGVPARTPILETLD